ncbi:MAG TPA: hypothetical protein VH500_09680 [Nitrososphaeraceae archaeon]
MWIKLQIQSSAMASQPANSSTNLQSQVSPAAAVDDNGKSSGGSSFGGIVPVSTTVITNSKSSTSCIAGESRNKDNQCVFGGPCPSGTITMRHNFDKIGICFRK